MTKFFTLLIISLFFICGIADAQRSEISIAKYLADQANATKAKKCPIGPVQDILKKYYPPGTLINQSTLDADAANPFFQNLFVDGGSAGALPADIQGFLSGGAAGIGGLDVTKLANGLAQFLAERTKEELNIAFFERFRDVLQAYPEVGRVFPATSTFLNTILNYEYANMLETLRSAFEADLKNLPHNLAGVASLEPNKDCNCSNQKLNDKCKLRLANIQSFFNTEQGAALVMGLLIADGAISQKNPADILNAVVGNTKVQKSGGDVFQSLELLNIISQSLRSEVAGKTWISVTDFNNLPTIQKQFYMGLVLQKIRIANQGKGITIGGKSIDPLIKTATALDTYISGLLQAGDALATSIAALSKTPAKDNATLINNINQFVTNFKTFFDNAINYTSIDNSIPAPDEKVTLIFGAVDQGLIMVQHILEKDYGSAVLDATLLCEDLMKTRDDFNHKGQLLNTNNLNSANKIFAQLKVANIAGIRALDPTTFEDLQTNSLTVNAHEIVLRPDLIESLKEKQGGRLKKVFLQYFRKQSAGVFSYQDDTHITVSGNNFFMATSIKSLNGKTGDEVKKEFIKQFKHEDPSQFSLKNAGDMKVTIAGNVETIDNALAKSLGQAQGKVFKKIFIQSVKAMGDEALDRKDFLRKLLRYGNFMTAVVAAKSSADVKKAIETIALPPGSSAIKKNTNFSIALQAYVGISTGRETASSLKGVGNFFNALNVYGPLGFSFNIGLKSWRNPENKINAGSLTVFGSVIDVGAIVGYELKNPAAGTSDSVKIRLENILAPGANLVYGLPKVPLSIGTGLQWLPSLARYSNQGLSIANQSGFRFQIFLAVDIPALSLFTSRK